MSVRVWSRVWPLALPTPEKIVLLKLADACRADGSEARPAVSTIMDHTGLRRTTVYSALRSLEARGLIRQTVAADRARHEPAVYRLNLDMLPAEVPGSGDGPGRVRETDPEVDPADTTIVRQTDPAGFTTRTRPGPPDGPNPSYTRPIPVQEERSAPAREAAEPASDDLADEMVGIYRETLGDILPVPKKLTPQRRKAALARLKDACGGDIETWRHVCQQVAGSAFLTGHGPRGWRADLDWLLKPDNLLKLSEGKYADHAPAGPPSRMDRYARAAADLERRRAPGAAWVRSQEGDRVADVADVFDHIRNHQEADHD